MQERLNQTWEPLEARSVQLPEEDLSTEDRLSEKALNMVRDLKKGIHQVTASLTEEWGELESSQHSLNEYRSHFSSIIELFLVLADKWGAIFGSVLLTETLGVLAYWTSLFSRSQYHQLWSCLPGMLCTTGTYTLRSDSIEMEVILT